MYTGRMLIKLLVGATMLTCFAVAQESPTRIIGGAEFPTRTKFVQPIYPPLAKAAGVQGKVVIETTIDKTGKIVEAKIVSGPAMLRQAALEALVQWEFNPFLIDGKPTDIITDLEINFALL